jgi:serine/threonine-protein kinase
MLFTIFLLDRIILPKYVKLGDVVTIPDVRGMKLEEASQILIDNGLNPYVKGTRESQEEPGTVLDSDPPPLMRVKRGRKVGLIVSKGKLL